MLKLTPTARHGLVLKQPLLPVGQGSALLSLAEWWPSSTMRTMMIVMMMLLIGLIPGPPALPQ